MTDPARNTPRVAVVHVTGHYDVGVAGLAAGWRSEATHLRERYGADGLARLCEAHARELEGALAVDAARPLTLQEAARQSGYSRSHLRAMLTAGVLRNVGRKGSPRILRGELPTKSGSAPGPQTRRARPARKRGTFDAAASARRSLRGHPVGTNRE